MLLLVSGATKSVPFYDVGVLVVPKQWNLVENLPLEHGRWAMDSGAFSGFDEGAYVRMLERFSGKPGCLFVTAPDVVGDHASTLRRWRFWSHLLRGLGHNPAFVAQDGLTADSVPWDEMGALFIGGTTVYKESTDVQTLCGLAKAKGIWVHWGRVNSKRRLKIAARAGCDSYDGTGFSLFPDTNIPKSEVWTEEIRRQPELPMEA